MAKHIGRKQAVGIGMENPSGTPVAAVAWIPKQSSNVAPTFDKAVDDSSYGVIDEVYDSQTVKNKTDIQLNGILRDDWIGYLLKATMGTATKLVCITIAGAVGGSPARGDSISSVAGGWTAIIRKILVVNAVTYYFVEETVGNVDAQVDVTDGTWTDGTSAVIAGVNAHFFQRLNTNNHPAMTVYTSDDVGDERASYCMVDSFEMEFAVGDYGKFAVNMMGKKLEAAAAQNPAYSSDNAFLAKHANVSLADNEAGLNAAAAEGDIQRFKITVNKNLTDIQAFGDTDISSLHNQQFGIAGDLEATYDATTYRDLVANSTKKAARLSAINSEAAALNGDIYPSVYVDMSRLSFQEWSRSNDNNAIVNQTMGFSGEYDNDIGATVEILLLNGNAVGY